VNQLYIKIKFDTFEQLMLHYDFCAFSFLELLDWIKPCVEIIWKTWRTKEIDWGPSPSLSIVLHQATTSLLAQGKKESESNTFRMLDSNCRIERVQIQHILDVGFGLQDRKSPNPTRFGCWIRTAG
jgi:hypothetical protein